MIIGFEEYRHRYNFDVRGIVHVGAHIGQEYASYIETFGKVDTHWFEPLTHIYSLLESGIGSEPGVFLYNFALGESESSVEMYVDSANGGQSSSILQPKEHTSIYSHIVFDGRETVRVKRLDDFDLGGCNMLVIDTQGFELSVLKGGNDTLKKIDYIFIEFNSVEMYEGCPTLEDIDSFLSGFGFSRKETWHTDGKWGDAFYMRDREDSLSDYSQYGEQDIIMNFFSGRDAGNLRFMDIGANDGIVFSNTYAISRMGWSGVCIEPSRMAFDKLVGVHGGNPKIGCYNIGISDSTGKRIFHESRDWDNSEAPVSVLSCLDPFQKQRFFGMNWEETECDFYTFPDFLSCFDIGSEKFDFVSIDCEGHDYVVLDQIGSVLSEVELICIEFLSDQDIESYGRYLSDKGLYFYARTECNVFFSRKVKREIVIIDSFVSNKDVERLLVSQISRFKSRGLDVMVVSNTPLERDIIESVDYYLYDRRNQLFQNDYDDVAGVRFTETIHSDGMSFVVHKITPGLQRHGLSVLVNMHNSVALAKSLGYDRFWRVEVDDLFGEDSMDFILSSGKSIDSSGKRALLFRNLPSESNFEIRPNISFHFMYWDVDYFLSVVPKIGCEEDYVRMLDSVYGSRRFVIAEEFVYDSLVRAGDVDVLFMDGGRMDRFFPDTSWNTCTSLSNMGMSGSSTSVYNIPGDGRKFVFSKSYVDGHVHRRISLVYPGGRDELSHEMSSLGSWCWNIVGEGLLSIEVSDGDGNFLYSEAAVDIPSYVEFI